jgi:hypothetical protein
MPVATPQLQVQLGEPILAGKCRITYTLFIPADGSDPFVSLVALEHQTFAVVWCDVMSVAEASKISSVGEALHDHLNHPTPRAFFW